MHQLKRELAPIKALVERSLKMELQQLAARNDRSVSAELRLALREHIAAARKDVQT
jgi:hypothetical protein